LCFQHLIRISLWNFKYLAQLQPSCTYCLDIYSFSLVTIIFYFYLLFVYFLIADSGNGQFNFQLCFPYSQEHVAWVINVTFFTIIENNSYRKSPKRKWWVAKAYKKRGSHTEEAAIPGYASSANFCQWSYCNLIVDIFLISK
jgi:hypothetical protein